MITPFLAFSIFFFIECSSIRSKLGVTQSRSIPVGQPCCKIYKFEANFNRTPGNFNRKFVFHKIYKIPFNYHKTISTVI
jgi:hypothetical protein